MSTRFSGAAGAFFVLATSLIIADVQAQTIYLGGEAGWSVLEDQRDKVVGKSGVRARFDSGYAAGARVGYEWGPWRFEEEYAYRSNDLNHLGSFPSPRGGRQSHAVMTNLLYDLPYGFGPVTPHIGAGVGAVNIIDHAKSPGLPVKLKDDDWQFGYQAIAGLRYSLTPAVALDLDYRYLATTDATFRIPGTTLKYKTGYDTHTLMASMVYRFGPPPVVAPPVAPAPAPVARRVFLVFFDWDRATITPEGGRVIQQAADAYRSGAPVQLQVTGYTDASGSVGYNQRLSERRANAVADALARLGVPRNEMIVSGRGKSDQRVPTADGEREPQNRRVEILFP